MGPHQELLLHPIVHRDNNYNRMQGAWSPRYLVDCSWYVPLCLDNITTCVTEEKICSLKLLVLRVA